MSKIGKDFQPEHMQEALKAKGFNHEELLKGASGGGGQWAWGPAAASATAGADNAAAARGTFSVL